MSTYLLITVAVTAMINVSIISNPYQDGYAKAVWKESNLMEFSYQNQSLSVQS
ncbi:MAG: hypothetical protein IPF67_13355 [Saprospiraceae bacterium]|nr:hypothetical protein [Candidatus Brachybacter algidus]